MKKSINKLFLAFVKIFNKRSIKEDELMEQVEKLDKRIARSKCWEE